MTPLDSLNRILAYYGFGPVHVHEFTEVDVQEVKKPYTMFGSYAATLVLERCECGEKRTVELEGVWSLEQVQGISRA